MSDPQSQPQPAPPAQPTSAGVTLSPIADHDWAGFAGAEKFPNGDRPVTATGVFTDAARREWFLVCDRNGACLVVQDDPQNDHGGYVLERSFARAADAQAWVSRFLGTPARLEDFLFVGFARC